MRSLFPLADRLPISPCEVGRTLLSSLVSKPSRCSFCFGEKGCLSSRDAPWQRHFANRHELKSTSRTAEKESLTQGGARGFSGCCRGLGTWEHGSNARSCGQSHAQVQVHEGGHRWLHEALVHRCQFVCYPLLPFTTHSNLCTLSFCLL